MAPCRNRKRQRQRKRERQRQRKRETERENEVRILKRNGPLFSTMNNNVFGFPIVKFLKKFKKNHPQLKMLHVHTAYFGE